ncbi:MAG: phosphocarrier protein HPr [Caldiserica bacterium]|mgnify:CR=1 FL=1|nr:MAG: phosphocarrier protein HPr [Caldisericota bacterium]
MIVKYYVLRNKIGMHVRPAGILAELVSKMKSDVKIEYNGSTADARSPVAVLSLGIMPGDRIKVIIDGEDEEKVLRELDTLIIERKFDEE